MSKDDWTAEPGVTVCVGTCGAGKTAKLKGRVMSAVRQGWRVAVVDTVTDWPSFLPDDVADVAFETTSVPDGLRALDKGAQLVILRPDDDEVEQVARRAAQWVWDNRADGQVGLAIHEAHYAAPTTRIPVELRRLATAWRPRGESHAGLHLWADSQRVSSLNRAITDMARELFMFGLAGDRDLEVARDIGGQELAKELKEAARRLAKKEDGGEDEPGWYVRLPLVRVPPYKLRRDDIERGEA